MLFANNFLENTQQFHDILKRINIPERFRPMEIESVKMRMKFWSIRCTVVGLFIMFSSIRNLGTFMANFP